MGWLEHGSLPNQGIQAFWPGLCSENAEIRDRRSPGLNSNSFPLVSTQAFEALGPLGLNRRWPGEPKFKKSSPSLSATHPSLLLALLDSWDRRGSKKLQENIGDRRGDFEKAVPETSNLQTLILYIYIINLPTHLFE